MAQMRLSVNHLREGMIMKEDIYTRAGAILVAEGEPVTKDVIRLLTRHFIEDVIVESPSDGTKTLTKPAQSGRIGEKQFRQFEESFRVAESMLSDNLKEIAYQSKDVDVDFLLGTLNGVLGTARTDAELADLLLLMKKKVQGLYSHAISVSLFGQILARWVNCTKREIELVTAAGILHDIGMLKFPERMLEHFLFCDELETSRYEKHAIYGYNIIKDDPNIDLAIKQAVLTHHERMDGSGFPMKVIGTHINRISRIIAIVDTYDTYTMSEHGGEGLSTFSAIKKMQDCGYNKLDSEFLLVFLTHIAETMIRHSVRLSDGREGQVVMINKYNLSSPLIQVGNTFVDLSKEKELHVSEVLD